MQANCLRLMGRKLLVALAMEGKFAGEGLQSLDEDDDMLTSMAKELVEKNGIGESADSVWKALNSEHRRMFPTRQAIESAYEVPDDIDGETNARANTLIEETLNSHPVFVFGQGREQFRSARRRPRVQIPEQGVLFNWTQ